MIASWKRTGTLTQSMFWAGCEALVLAAFLLRAYHLDFGLPQRLHPDEASQVETALRMSQGDPNPHFFRYPSLMMNLLAGLDGLILKIYPGASLSSFYLTSRVVSVLFGTGTLVLLFLWGYSIWGRWAALVGAALFALAASPVLHAHYATVDTLMVFWSTATFLTITLAFRRNEVRWIYWAAVFAGLAVSSKYNAALLIFPLLLSSILLPPKSLTLSKRAHRLLVLFLAVSSLACLVFWGWMSLKEYLFLAAFASLSSDGVLEPEYLGMLNLGKSLVLGLGLVSIFVLVVTGMKPSLSIWPRLFSARNFSVLVIVILSFCLTSPFVIIEWRQAAQDFFYEARHMQIGGLALLPVELHGANIPERTILPSALPILRLVWTEMGLIAICLAFLGLYEISKIEKSLAVVLGVYIILLLLTVSSWQNWSARYLLALFPILAFLSAGGWSAIRNRLPSGKIRQVGPALLTVILLIQPAWVTRQNLVEFSMPDTREPAFSWMLANIPPGSSILRDPYSPDLTAIEHPFSIIEANPFVLTSFNAMDLVEMGLPIVVTTFDPDSPSMQQWVSAEGFAEFLQLYEPQMVFPVEPGKTKGRTIFIYAAK